MAMAVQRLHPSARCTIGPWIERGFYYDFATPDGAALTDADLPAIKKEMATIIKAKLPFVREDVTVDDARARIQAAGEPYKAEILDSIVSRDPAAPITIYHIGEPNAPGSWWDLCAGPHVANTGDINAGAIDLESVAGAYWRGDEAKPMLSRVYGTAWRDKGQLKAYNALKAEAARRDHRKLGVELDLFSIRDETGAGLVLWHPAGALVRSIIEDYWRKVHADAGYDFLYTPHVARQQLWRTSGHYEFYADAMFDGMDVEKDVYQLRPMNCPFHIAIYQTSQRSYRDLPLRWCELGTVYRYERSGTMHGLFRVRGFTQDDGHIFCLPDQIAGEIEGVLTLVQTVMGGFGFHELEVNLSTRPEKAVGSDDIWDTAQTALIAALDAKGLTYKVDLGGGAFYGPKIDIKVKDALGRKWQCSTIQLDFNLPSRFGMEYVAADGTRRRPIMIHRAIFGSLERFFGILVENYGGAFPLWLAPVQVRVLAVAPAFEPYAASVVDRLKKAGIRATVVSGDRINKMIRSAEKAKTPIMAVVGEREVEGGTLALRTYASGDAGSMAVDDFVEKVVGAVAERRESW